MVLSNSIGSVATHIITIIENVPVAISGAMLDIVNEARLDLNNHVGFDIGSPTFPEKYIPALTNMSISETLSTMLTVGIDATSVRIGEFSYGGGKGSNLDAAQGYYDRMADKALKRLGGKAIFVKANG